MKKLSKLPTDTTGYNTTNYIYYKSNHFLAMHYYEEAIEHKDPEMLRESYEYVKRAIAINNSNEAILLLIYHYNLVGYYSKITPYIDRGFSFSSTKEHNEFHYLFAIAGISMKGNYDFNEELLKYSEKISFKFDNQNKFRDSNVYFKKVFYDFQSWKLILKAIKRDIEENKTFGEPKYYFKKVDEANKRGKK